MTEGRRSDRNRRKVRKRFEVRKSRYARERTCVRDGRHNLFNPMSKGEFPYAHRVYLGIYTNTPLCCGMELYPP